MPLTFAEAYAKVCPEGGVVVPNSKEYNDIMALIKQSGHKNYKETIVADSAPRKPKSVEETYLFIPTKEVMEKPTYTSRNAWMSVDANRQEFLNALNKK